MLCCSVLCQHPQRSPVGLSLQVGGEEEGGVARVQVATAQDDEQNAGGEGKGAQEEHTGLGGRTKREQKNMVQPL